MVTLWRLTQTAVNLFRQGIVSGEGRELSVEMGI